jgi:glycosyltransferase involved in cell wall biosynthesis
VFGLNKKFKIIPNSIDVDLFSHYSNGLIKDIVLYFGSLIERRIVGIAIHF